MKFRIFFLLSIFYAWFAKDGKSQSTKLAPDCSIPISITATAQRLPFSGFNNNGNNGTNSCVYWVVSYQSQGFSAISLEVDVAIDTVSGGVHSPGSWSAFASGYIADGRAAGAASGPGVNPNTDTNWAYTSFLGSPAWISVTLASSTGSGSISGTLLGWRPHGNGDTAIAPPAVGPGGANTDVQFNDSGTFGGDSRFTFNKSTGTMAVTTVLEGLAAPLATAAAPGVVPTCSGTCATTYTYVNAYCSVVGCALESSATSASNAATLDGSHFNTITPPACPAGAVAVRVRRTASGGNNGFDGNIGYLSCPVTTLVDNGIHGDNNTVSYTWNMSVGAYAGNHLRIPMAPGFQYWTTNIGSDMSEFTPDLAQFAEDHNFLFAFHGNPGQSEFQSSAIGSLCEITAADFGVTCNTFFAFSANSAIPIVGTDFVGGFTGTGTIYNVSAARGSLVPPFAGQTITNGNAFHAHDATISSLSTSGTITNQVGFLADDLTVGGTKNTGFESDVTPGSGKSSFNDVGGAGIGTAGISFATLSGLSQSNGFQHYCSDCTVTSSVNDTCAGSGSGAQALRINGAWKCVI